MKLNELLLCLEKYAPYTMDQSLSKQTEITAITSRSAQVVPNSIFVCLHGSKNNGEDFIPQAIANGAVLVIGEQEKPTSCSVAYLQCSRPRLALSVLCDAFWGHPTAKVRVIGVTGTNGKSSTLSFLYHLLTYSGKLVGLCTTVEDRLPNESFGTSGMTTQDPEELYPKLRRMADAGIEYLLLEVSSHALQQEKVAPIHFEYALLTNFTPEHLDFHQSMEAYATAKAKLFLQSDKAILPHTMEYADLFATSLPQEHYTYSTSDISADFSLVHPTTTSDGIRYEFLAQDLLLRIRIPSFGNFTFDNSLLAISCALQLGVPSDKIQGACQTMPQVKGRLEQIFLPVEAPFCVFLDYAHTPDALERVLLSLQSIRLSRPEDKRGRICLLFGCGGNRDNKKRTPMGAIAASLADFIIITEDNNRQEIPEEIFTEILAQIPIKTPHVLITHRKEAIEYLIAQAKENDILLLAGKGHENYEIQADGIHPFDERYIIQQFYQMQWGQNHSK